MTDTPNEDSKPRTRILILGAAGRDFHNFNVVFRDDENVEVVAFTAAQIPNIAGRTYPAELAGSLYPHGIPILAHDDWESIVRDRAIDQVIFAYSDVPHIAVMDIASRALARGADFRLLGPAATMLRSRLPVVSVCAVRTGAGKSPATRYIARFLRESGLRVAVVRHPMPYGNLRLQAVQRFSTIEDLARQECTIEEMEEYEPHIVRGDVVFAGVDYERVLHAAEDEADVILWDGGNNDLPFFQPDLELVLVDPHRAGDELSYFPGFANLLRADVVLIAKVNTATRQQVETVTRSASAVNPAAPIIETSLDLHVDKPERIRGARVLVIEDGPTITHGGMAFGAGAIAAREAGAKDLIDPRPFASGSIVQTFEAYPHITNVLPAMGYGDEQVSELEETVRRADCDTVIIATPIDLGRVIQITKPTCRVTYDFSEVGERRLPALVSDAIARSRLRA